MRSFRTIRRENWALAPLLLVKNRENIYMHSLVCHGLDERVSTRDLRTREPAHVSHIPGLT